MTPAHRVCPSYEPKPSLNSLNQSLLNNPSQVCALLQQNILCRLFGRQRLRLFEPVMVQSKPGFLATVRGSNYLNVKAKPAKVRKKQRLIFIFNEISIPLKSHLKTFRQIRSKKNEGETQAHAIQVSIIRKRTIRSFATTTTKMKNQRLEIFPLGCSTFFCGLRRTSISWA